MLIYILNIFIPHSYQFGRHLDDTNKVQHGLPFKFSMNENNNVRQHAEVGNEKTKMPPNLSKYFEVYMFAEILQSNDSSKLLAPLQDRCSDRYAECPLEIK